MTRNKKAAPLDKPGSLGTALNRYRKYNQPPDKLQPQPATSLWCRHVIISNQMDNVEWIANSHINGNRKDSEIEKTAMLLHALLLKKRNRIEEELGNG